jgi:hypothetical protein
MFARFLALGCLLYVCASPAPSETVFPQTGEIYVYLNPAMEISPAVVREMRAEVDLILLMAGYRVSWLGANDVPDVEGSELIVVNFSGPCVPESEQSVRSPGGRRLAGTAMVNGRILPFISVECGTLNHLLSPSLRREPAGRWESHYGKALGRILSHEIYHVMAQTRTHSRSGVAMAAVPVRDLLRERFEFADDASKAIAVFRTGRRVRGSLASSKSLQFFKCGPQ